MKLIKTIILTLFISLGFIPIAQGEDDIKFEWMKSSLMSLGSVLPSCIEAPIFASIHQSSTTLNVENNSGWVPTGVYVQQGKMLSMLWDTSGISLRPRKYRVLYRVDPRFSRPQIFIQKYDYTEEKYISDFHHYKSEILPFYQDRPEIFNSQRFDDFKDYFNFVDRETISVQKDDVINITLDGEGDFFGSDGEMQNGLGNGTNPITIYTNSSGINNKILYTSGKRWCMDIITTADPSYAAKCNTFPDKYIDSDWSALRGETADSSFTSKLLSIPSCPDNVDGPDNIPACFYDKGRGFKVTVGGSVVKAATQKFVYSPFTGKYFLYHYSDAVGDLNFSSSWPILGMYQDLSQTMEEWKTFATGNDASDIIAFNAYLNSMSTAAPMNFLHFGVYAMEIEIGKGHNALSDADLGNINVEYTILDSGTPNSSSSSNSLPQNFRNDAYASGYVWLKVTGTEGMAGNINVKLANYTGSNWFSSVVYGSLLKPLRDKYNELSQIIYRKLISNAALQNIAKSLLVLYVIIYGLVFLLGAVQITATDIVTRVLKVGVIVALFSDTSWTFFNDNLFNVFISGSDYLLTTVVGATSSTGNIFGFIDPIFDRYTNGNLWSLLAIQLLQIHNGLAFFSIMTIYGILIYFRAVLEVIISYCLAFLGIAVMISLAPFFILMILFERTRSMFDNWLSTLFSYMMQPTILLIFFLLIDQMMSEYITGTVVKACWGILFPIKIGLDLSNIGIPISFSFPLPFLPGIPFYVPQVQNIDSAATLIGNSGTFIRIASSAFIFFVYCKLAAGLVEYVSLVVQYLTNVLAARQDGALQKHSNPVKDIMGDMSKLASPVTGAIKGVGSFAKEKFIDQKITSRPSIGTGEADYSKIKRPESAAAENKGEVADKAATKIEGTSGSVAPVAKSSKESGKTDNKQETTASSGGGDKENRSKSTGVNEAQKEKQASAGAVKSLPAKAKEQLKGLRDSAKKQLTDLPKKAKEQIGSLPGKAKEQLKGLRDNAKKQLTSLPKKAKEQAGNLRKEASSRLKALPGKAKEQLKGLKNNAKKQVTSLPKKAKEQVSGLRKEASSRLKALPGKAKEQLKGLKDNAKKQLKSLPKKAKEQAGKLRKEASERIKALPGKAKEELKGLRDKAKKQLTKLPKKAKEQLSNLKKEATGQLKSLRKALIGDKAIDMRDGKAASNLEKPGSFKGDSQETKPLSDPQLKKNETQDKTDNTPPPVPSRDTEEYKEARERILAQQDEKDIASPPPVPSRDTEGYKEGIEKVRAKKEEIAKDKSESDIPNTNQKNEDK